MFCLKETGLMGYVVLPLLFQTVHLLLKKSQSQDLGKEILNNECLIRNLAFCITVQYIFTHLDLCIL